MTVQTEKMKLDRIGDRREHPPADHKRHGITSPWTGTNRVSQTWKAGESSGLLRQLQQACRQCVCSRGIAPDDRGKDTEDDVQQQSEEHLDEERRQALVPADHPMKEETQCEAHKPLPVTIYRVERQLQRMFTQRPIQLSRKRQNFAHVPSTYSGSMRVCSVCVCHAHGCERKCACVRECVRVCLYVCVWLYVHVCVWRLDGCFRLTVPSIACRQTLRPITSSALQTAFPQRTGTRTGSWLRRRRGLKTDPAVGSRRAGLRPVALARARIPHASPPPPEARE